MDIEDAELFGKAFIEFIVDHLKKRYTPGDIFDDGDLELWAVNNGFVRVQDNKTAKETPRPKTPRPPPSEPQEIA